MMSQPSRRSSPWRAVIGFGIVSLLADMVYEGARSITGPLLASLGASAVLVGLITGAGEAIALVLRLFFGTLADRTGNYWGLTLAGYGLTAVSVPLLAITPFLGAAGLVVATILILIERTGKAVRSPSKTALLALATEGIGRGRGFGVHKALDQCGSVLGPLLVAAVIAFTMNIWPAMGILLVPGVLAMVVLFWIRAHMQSQPGPETEAQAARPTTDNGSWIARNVGADLPHAFFVFAAAAGAATAGLVSYGLIGFHLTTRNIVPTAVVPVLYAAAMGAAAIAALLSGWVYDYRGAKVLYALPVLVAAIPALAFSTQRPLVLAGIIVWGAAVGLQDSTVKALVADLVPAPRRATAYGVFAAIQGAAAVVGGGMAGYLYSRSLPALVVLTAFVQIGALVLLIINTREQLVSSG